MDTKIKTKDTPKTFFTVQENSNYKVLMTYDREEVIEYAQFAKLMQVINDGAIPFLTINQRIINKNTIIDISPTTEKTTAQKELANQRLREARKKEDEKHELEKLKKYFEVSFYDNLYGKDGWMYYPKITPNPLIHTLTREDREMCWEEFKKIYPKTAKAIEEIENV